MARKLFCELGPMCYEISLQKEIFKRHLQDFFSPIHFAKDKSTDNLPCLVKNHFSLIVRKLAGIDMDLQYSKKANIELASKMIDGIVIHPGEVFSFWQIVKKPTRGKGYQDGLIVTRKGFSKGVGGGLCQMANLVHWLILNSPLEVVELHHHSDALFPDFKRRVPFGTGTSVCYNALDYRFRNNTDMDIQIRTWCEDGMLWGELRSEKPFAYRYRIIEEDHHYHKEGDRYYRISKVYQQKIDKDTGNIIEQKLVLDNHSLVVYDHDLIPKDEIR